MINFTKLLKGYDTSIRWNTKINKYIKDNKARLQFNKGKSEYFTSVDTAIATAKSFINIDNELKLTIINDLLERKVLELNSASLIAPVAQKKEDTSLDSTHFNIYGVRNIQELGNNIINDIKECEPESIKDLFKEYVYCFTYMYKYNSTKTNLTTIRGMIKNSDLEESKKTIALREFSFPNRIYDFINDGLETKKEKNMTGVLEPIELPFLHRFFLKAKKYLDYKVDKHNKREVYSFLSCMTVLAIGRRLDEIVNKSTVEKVSDYKVKITGLAKKRGDVVPVIIVPTLLASADEVIKAISILKAQIPKGIKSELKKKDYVRKLVDVDSFIDKKLWKKGSIFSYQRAIYAVVAELIYNQNNINEENRKPQATYITGVLGHNEGDRSTYEFYYKRQALIRNFDLKSYLEEAKTAMI